MTPEQASLKMNESHLLNTAYNYNYRYEKPKFRVHDLVRISLKHRLFEKAYEGMKFSTLIYRITEANYISPQTFKLQEFDGTPITGIFYAPELCKVDDEISETYLIEKVLRKRGNKLFVKYLGMDRTGWIEAANVFDVRNRR
jgi:hypothetical protein